MKSKSAKVKFFLGQVVATASVAQAVEENELQEYMLHLLFGRHAQGDWGDVCPEDKKENEWSLENDCRIMSVYKDTPIGDLWIITEADRSSTTVLKPEEY